MGEIFHCFETFRWVTFVLTLLFVPLSRVCLGVHFPIDTFGGYVFGIITLFLFMKLEQPVINYLKILNLQTVLLLSLIIPSLLALSLPRAEPAAFFRFSRANCFCVN